MWDGMPGGGMGFAGFGWVIWLLLLILIVAVLWPRFSGGSAASTTPTALEILKRRLAAGEIDEQEYQRIKKQLEERD